MKMKKTDDPVVAVCFKPAPKVGFGGKNPGCWNKYYG